MGFNSAFSLGDLRKRMSAAWLAAHFQNGKETYVLRSDWGKTTNILLHLAGSQIRSIYALSIHENAIWLFQHTPYRVLDEQNKQTQTQKAHFWTP